MRSLTRTTIRLVGSAQAKGAAASPRTTRNAATRRAGRRSWTGRFILGIRGVLAIRRFSNVEQKGQIPVEDLDRVPLARIREHIPDTLVGMFALEPGGDRRGRRGERQDLLGTVLPHLEQVI